MAGKGDKLSGAAQTFVVQSLAMWDPPSVVVAAVRKEYGVTITRQSVEVYDPTKRAGAKLAERWKKLFHETRESFVQDTAKIAISHRAVRLRTIQRVAEKAETMGNLSLALQATEQAAKEAGDAFTNRQRHEHSGEVAVKGDLSEAGGARLAAILEAARRRREGEADSG